MEESNVVADAQCFCVETKYLGYFQCKDFSLEICAVVVPINVMLFKCC